MLSEFLEQNKKKILQLCRDKVFAAGGSKPTSALLDQGLPIFYDELVAVLSKTATTSTTDIESLVVGKNETKKKNAIAHGKESSRLGYTISQVVHAYGAVCQSITEFVQTCSTAT